MDAIRDDGGTKVMPNCWEDADQWLSATRHEIETLRMDRQEGQPKRLILYCEAAGMVPQVERVANEYGIPVISSGGFDSLTEKHALGEEYNDAEVLHIGDLDPHGIHIFIALAEDVSAFASHYGNVIDFTRLAVTPKQIEKLHLDTSPLERNDKTPAYPHDFTCQAEAIPPNELAKIVRKAILDRLDDDAYSAVLVNEDELHTELEDRLSD